MRRSRVETGRGRRFQLDSRELRLPDHGIPHRRLRIFDRDTPAIFRFADRRQDREQSAFIQT